MASQVLLVTDGPHWAFGAIAAQLTQRNDRHFNLTTYHLKKGFSVDDFLLKAQQADLVFFMHWSLACTISRTKFDRFIYKRPFRMRSLTHRFPEIPLDKTLVGIHAHHDHDDRKSQPDHKILPPPNLVSFLSQFKGVNAVSNRLVQYFEESGLANVCYTPNGVNTEQFTPAKSLNLSDKLRVGVSGTKKRDWKEGITEFIEPLADLPFVDLRMAIPQEGKYVPHEQMPDFLNQFDVYVLASASEGFPLKALEAAACGRPVVTTKVGGCEDFVIDGENGFFVKRSVDAFAEKLKWLHENRKALQTMGEQSRKNIENHWSWDLRSKAWLDFIEAHLEKK